ncbi:ORF51 [Haliotid herpesvirus 1]|uniref:Uncharacterized protein n=1 Tax=Abalone herpesvirus Taiwan/2005 TaxID=1821058 RepID=A0A145VV98_9VIRU|nr:tc_p009c [Abalone herpesvirus Taiwan/2004]AMW36235.1 hypothetical protein tc2005_p091c [Abalone herpesvirus Taiwan/2005]UCX57042.1 ORF51 [Haliotid herpesvirus 1]
MNSTTEFYLFLKKFRSDLCKVFGAHPPQTPIIDEKFTHWKWRSNVLLRRITAMIVLFLDPKAINKHKRVYYLVTDSIYIALLQCLSYIFKEGRLPITNIEEKQYEPLQRLVGYIIEVVKFKPEDRTFSTVRLPVYVKNGHLKLSYTQMFDRQFAEGVATLAKRGVGVLQNNFVTEIYQAALHQTEEELYDDVTTDVNFCRRVAVASNLINAKIPFMTLESLTEFTEILYHRLSGGRPLDSTHIPAALDADMIHLFTHVSTALKSRLTTKSIDVMPYDCTCYVKCRGPSYGHVKFNQMVDDLHHTALSTRICGLCRLSLTVKNTTSAKPKRYMMPECPGVTVCSHDGCSTAFLSRTNIFDKEEEGKGLFTAGHRVFISNSLPITDPLYRQKVSTAKGRHFTTCISGSRTCYGRAVKNINSAKQSEQREREKIPKSKETKEALFKPDFYNLKKWWRCNPCQDMADYNPESHTFFREAMHDRSCVGTFLSSIKGGLCKVTQAFVDEKCKMMCLNCRAACMCRHAQSGLVNRMVEVKELAAQSKTLLSDKSARKKLSKKERKAREEWSEGGIADLIQLQKLLTMVQSFVVNNTPEFV